LGLAALIIAGCGSSKTNSASTTTVATTTAPASTSPTTSGASHDVNVSLTEFHITLPAMSFTPGTYTFSAKNNGAAAHALAIRGPGANASTPTLAAGGSASFTVTLQAGTNELSCPVDSHKSLGMDTRITISG
jgi:plastocyanin